MQNCLNKCLEFLTANPITIEPSERLNNMNVFFYNSDDETAAEPKLKGGNRHRRRRQPGEGNQAGQFQET